MECLATTDSCAGSSRDDSHGGGGRSLKHLCTTPPETCSCTDGQMEREFHSEFWRRITRENVAQGDLSCNFSEIESNMPGTATVPVAQKLLHCHPSLTGIRRSGVQSGGRRRPSLLTQILFRFSKVSPLSGTQNNKPFSLLRLSVYT